MKIVIPTETPVLPSCWVSCNYAFQKVGLDFAGRCKRLFFFHQKYVQMQYFTFYVLRYKSSVFRTTEAIVRRFS